VVSTFLTLHPLEGHNQYQFIQADAASRHGLIQALCVMRISPPTLLPRTMCLLQRQASYQVS